MTETSVIISAFILILVASFAMYTINKNQETVSKQLSDAKVSLEKASHNQVIVQPYDPYLNPMILINPIIMIFLCMGIILEVGIIGDDMDLIIGIKISFMMSYLIYFTVFYQ